MRKNSNYLYFGCPMLAIIIIMVLASATPTNSKNVIIMGGGIGGLTTAHYLTKHGFKVTIFEKNQYCGGLARSREVDSEGNPTCPSEYSWRVFSPCYFNTFAVLKEIPDPSSSKEGRTAFDSLIATSVNHDSSEVPPDDRFLVNMKGVSFKEWFKLGSVMLRYLLSSDKRNVEEGSNLSFYEVLKDDLSESGYNQIIRTMGSFLGLEPESVSFYEALQGIERLVPYSHLGYEGEFMVTAVPTNWAWFNPWTKHLTSQGVQIYTHSTVEEIKMKNATSVDYIVVNGTKYFADYYVSALSLEVIAALTPPELKDVPTFKNLQPLAIKGRHMAISLQFYLSKKARHRCDTCLSYLKNAPWSVIILTYASTWGKNVDIPALCGESIRDIWSVSIVETLKPGILINKTFVEATRDEIAKELWYQVMSDREFVESVEVEGSTPDKKLTLDDVEVVGYAMWDSFVFNGTKMDTWEPKFSNNVGTKKLRPEAKTEVSNLFIANAWAQTTINFHGMESAVEGGMRAAHEILHANNIDVKLPVHQVEHLFPWALAIPRFIDEILFELNLPSLWSILCHLFIPLGAYCVLKVIKSIILKRLSLRKTKSE